MINFHCFFLVNWWDDVLLVYEQIIACKTVVLFTQTIIITTFTDDFSLQFYIRNQEKKEKDKKCTKMEETIIHFDNIFLPNCNTFFRYD